MRESHAFQEQRYKFYFCYFDIQFKHQHKPEKQICFQPYLSILSNRSRMQLNKAINMKINFLSIFILYYKILFRVANVHKSNFQFLTILLSRLAYFCWDGDALFLYYFFGVWVGLSIGNHYYNHQPSYMEPEVKYESAQINDQHNLAMSPQMYSQWYSSLPQQQKSLYCSPQTYYQYIQYYQQYSNGSYFQTYYNQSYQNGPYYQQYPTSQQQQHYTNNRVNNIQNQGNGKQNKKEKLSRNQKRKLKKQSLQEQYEKQKKQLGKWVDLERKDLVQGLKKIEQQEDKLREKRKEKLSHLIEIHKEVYKHMLKKNRGKIVDKRQKVGNFRVKKKKPSHIKRMKQLYQQVRQGKVTSNVIVKFKQQQIMRGTHQAPSTNKSQQQDYITQSESEVESSQQKIEQKKQQSRGKREKKKEKGKNICKQIVMQEKKQKQNKQNGKEAEPTNIKQVQIIQYQYFGRLAGQVWNNITIREWVNHLPSLQLQDKVLRFINRLAYKQAIKKVNQPEKARRIIIAGVHECQRTLWTKLENKRSKLLILSLNIERNNLQRGTDDQIQKSLQLAEQQNIPVIHCSTRSKLGRAFTGKFGPRITMISVINYEGYQDMMEQIMEEWNKLRKQYTDGGKL